MKREFSAGGIVINKQSFSANNGKVLLIKNAALRDPKKAYWGFPKGHINQGERSETAAIREIKEETGIEVEMVKKLGDSRYVFTKEGEKIFKVVVYFLFKYISGELRPQDLEVLEVKWVDSKEALSRLSFKKDQDFLKQVISENE